LWSSGGFPLRSVPNRNHPMKLVVDRVSGVHETGPTEPTTAWMVGREFARKLRGKVRCLALVLVLAAGQADAGEVDLLISAGGSSTSAAYESGGLFEGFEKRSERDFKGALEIAGEAAQTDRAGPAVQLGVGFEGRGGDTTFARDRGSFSARWDMSYFYLPVRIGWRQGGSRLAAFALAGCRPSLRVGGSNHDGREGHDPDDVYTRWDFGVEGSAGLTWRERVEVGIRYFHGLIDVLEPEAAFFEVGLKNRVLTGFVGLRVPVSW